MKLRAILLVLVIITSCTSVDKTTDFDKFTGRWSLHIVEMQIDSAANWVARQDHYKNRTGFILYDGKGGMGVHHVTENYQDYVFEGNGGQDSLTLNDLRHLANNFVYFGKYQVNDTLKRVAHHIESANLPTMWGSIAERSYTFSGDTLILSPISARYPKSRLKWVWMDDGQW